MRDISVSASLTFIRGLFLYVGNFELSSRALERGTPSRVLNFTKAKFLRFVVNHISGADACEKNENSNSV